MQEKQTVRVYNNQPCLGAVPPLSARTAAFNGDGKPRFPISLIPLQPVQVDKAHIDALLFPLIYGADKAKSPWFHKEFAKNVENGNITIGEPEAKPLVQPQSRETFQKLDDVTTLEAKDTAAIEAAASKPMRRR